MVFKLQLFTINFMNKETIKHELNRIGIKNTAKKAIILEKLKNSGVPINANELHKICTAILPVDIVTVYRTLQQFREKGIVQEFLGSDGVVKYEYSGLKSQPHPHFQCEKCHDVVCLGDLGFEDAIYFANMAQKNRIRSINIMLSGICESCQSIRSKEERVNV